MVLSELNYFSFQEKIKKDKKNQGKQQGRD